MTHLRKIMLEELKRLITLRKPPSSGSPSTSTARPIAWTAAQPRVPSAVLHPAQTDSRDLRTQDPGGSARRSSGAHYETRGNRHRDI